MKRIAERILRLAGLAVASAALLWFILSGVGEGGNWDASGFVLMLALTGLVLWMAGRSGDGRR